jgi:hypothetical protein
MTEAISGIPSPFGLNLSKRYPSPAAKAEVKYGASTRLGPSGVGR